MKEIDKKRPILILVAVAIALLSFFGASRIATSTDFHASSIATLDEKKTTVLELTAAAAAASAAITLMPGDTATPIADKLADLSTHFLIVLCALHYPPIFRYRHSQNPRPEAIYLRPGDCPGHTRQRQAVQSN